MLILPLGTSQDAKSGLPILTTLVCLTCIVLHFTLTNETKLAYAYDPKVMDVGRMISAAFLHGSLSHLLGNLFFFYCFSSTIEREISVKGYVLVFLLFAIITHVSYSFLTKSPLPSLGLSGVVWGFMGLFIVRFPFQRVECFVWFLWILRRVAVPAIIFVFGFLAMDIGAFRRDEPGVNHVAHLSGFMGGLLLIGLWNWLERGTTKPRPARVRPSASRLPVERKALGEQDWR